MFHIHNTLFYKNDLNFHILLNTTKAAIKEVRAIPFVNLRPSVGKERNVNQKHKCVLDVWDEMYGVGLRNKCKRVAGGVVAKFSISPTHKTQME